MKESKINIFKRGIIFIRNRIVQFLMLINLIIKSKIYKNKIYIIGTPIHGNLGDQAIIYSEVEFFNKFYPNKKIIEVESLLAKKNTKLLKKLIKNDLFFIHGGGFLGTIWLNEELMFRKILEEFKENKIIVLPQTVFFSNDENGLKELEKSKQIYEQHKNLYICCREEYSYEFMKKNFEKCNILLTPDIVLYNNYFEFNNERKDVLFCIRNDREKIEHSYEKIKTTFDKLNLNIDYTDTIIKKNVYRFNRESELKKKFNQISKYKIMITDRLHGMVFAFLTKTPCIVFENSSYKVKGLYKWIKNSSYIKMYNEETIEKDIEELLNIKPNYNNTELINEFLKLKELIEQCKKED